MGRKIYMNVIAAILLIAGVLSGCGHMSVSLTFQVQTGDQIKVTLDTTEGYSLSQEDGTIIVKKDDEEILQGAFLTEDMYQANLDLMQSMDGISITEGEQDGNSYLFYEYDGDTGYENGFLVMIENSDTGVFLASLMPQEDSAKAFTLLHFEKTE